GVLGGGPPGGHSRGAVGRGGRGRRRPAAPRPRTAFAASTENAILVGSCSALLTRERASSAARESGHAASGELRSSTDNVVSTTDSGKSDSEPDTADAG